MAISRPNEINDGVVYPQHLNENKFSKYTFEPFSVPPRFSDSLGNGAAAGTTGAINLIHTPFGTYEYHVLGAGQTIIVPVFDRANGLGLDFGQDQTVSEGHQLSFSPNIVTAGAGRGKHSYTIGTDKAFFARVKVRFSVIAGPAPWVFGFFRNQAYQTTLAGYTDQASIGVGTVTPAVIEIGMRVNNVLAFPATLAGVSNIVANVARTFEIRVSQQGVVTFLVDGVILPRSGTFAFDSGDVVMPRAFFLQSATPTAVFYQEFKAGPLPVRGDAGIRS